MKERQTFTCNCGFSWLEGLSGSHHCDTGYQKQIADLKAQLNHYVAAEHARNSFSQVDDIIKRADQAEMDLMAALKGIIPKGYVLIPEIPSEEQLRLLLAVTWPASYRTYLRHPMNGPKSSEENERQISVAKEQYAAVTQGLKPVQRTPVGYEYRGYDSFDGEWQQWEPVVPRSRTETVEDRLNEIKEYIRCGYRYEIRALYGEIIATWNGSIHDKADS